MKILIFGAGYVGLKLLKELQKSSLELFVTTTDESKISHLKNFADHVIVIKTNDLNNLKEVIDTVDAIIVLVAPKNSATYEETYLQTAKQLSCLLKNRSHPLYLLYTSSTSVCESTSSEWVTEEEKLMPTSSNAKILLETEEEYLNIPNTCVLRLGGIYGPGRELSNRAKYFSGKLLPGFGDESTNHIHQEDIVQAIQFCLNHRLRGLYQLVNDDHPTKKELYSCLCENENLPLPTWDLVKQDPRCNYKISNEKIKKAGFIFKHPHLRTHLTQKNVHFG